MKSRRVRAALIVAATGVALATRCARASRYANSGPTRPACWRNRRSRAPFRSKRRRPPRSQPLGGRSRSRLQPNCRSRQLRRSSPSSSDTPSEGAESPEQRQLNYANGLFVRKLYDLAIPEYEKFLGLYPDSPDRATALFYMGESYRALNRITRRAHQLSKYPARFPRQRTGRARFLRPRGDFFQRERLFVCAAAFSSRRSQSESHPRSRSPPAILKRVAWKISIAKMKRAMSISRSSQSKNPNPFRDDSRLAVGAIFLAAGRKADALKQFEALASETSKPSLKADATVRAGLVALDLAQDDKGQPDQAMTAKAAAFLQKGRNMPEAGRWSGIAAVGLLRLEYQAGQYAQAVADYQKSKDKVPDEVRPEMMLIAGNSQRQLGHYKEAQEIYRQIIQKYPGRDEAKDAHYQRLIGLYNANDPALRNEIDAFINDNPDGERADQAKLIKAEALYKAQDFAGAATVYAGLRDSSSLDETARGSGFQTRLVLCGDKRARQGNRGVRLFLAGVSRQSAGPIRSRPARSRLPGKQTIRSRAERSRSVAHQLSQAHASAKPRCSKRLSSSDNSTTARAWPRLSSSC